MEIEGFEWDDEKNELNQRNHKISFEQAVRAFDDPLAIPLEDPEHNDEGETRYALIGMCEVGLVFVSFTFRDESYRIVSARKASKKMEKMYVEQDY